MSTAINDTPSVEQPLICNERKNQNTLQIVVQMCDLLLGKMYTALTNRIRRKDAIHPDFLIRWKIDPDCIWYGNALLEMPLNPDIPIPNPPFKVGFCFDDPHILDSCRWVGKIKLNSNTNTRGLYFFVGYGDPSKHREGYDLQAMMEWAAQFDHPSLMHYDGRLIRMLHEEQEE